MDDLTLAIRQQTALFQPSEDAFERVVARATRRQRNRRVGSAVVALALFAVVDLGLLRGLAPRHGDTPGGPSPATSNDGAGFLGTDSRTRGSKQGRPEPAVRSRDLRTAVQGDPKLMGEASSPRTWESGEPRQTSVNQRAGPSTRDATAGSTVGDKGKERATVTRRGERPGRGHGTGSGRHQRKKHHEDCAIRVLGGLAGRSCAEIPDLTVEPSGDLGMVLPIDPLAMPASPEPPDTAAEGTPEAGAAQTVTEEASTPDASTTGASSSEGDDPALEPEGVDSGAESSLPIAP